MRELITRIAVTDDDAAGALRVIAYFDALIEGHASRAAILRAAAVLADCPAGLEDRSRADIKVVDPGGRHVPPGTRPSSQAWVDEQLGMRVWLERGGAAAGLDDLIVERCAAALRHGLDRAAPADRTSADVRTAVDEDADPAARAAAVRRLGLPARVAAVAALPVADVAALGLPRGRGSGSSPTGRWRATIGSVTVLIIEEAPSAPAQSATSTGSGARTVSGARSTPSTPGRTATGTSRPAFTHTRTASVGSPGPTASDPHPASAAAPVPAAALAGLPPAGWRLGVGGAVEPAELHTSWAQALLALRLTADGSPGEPGDLTVRHDDLGALALLAEAADTARSPVPDVAALDLVRLRHPWALVTLDALTRHSSLRQAAVELHLHHSSLQERVATLEQALGYSPVSPAGRTRATLALALRRLARSGDVIGAPDLLP